MFNYYNLCRNGIAKLEEATVVFYTIAQRSVYIIPRNSLKYY